MNVFEAQMSSESRFICSWAATRLVTQSESDDVLLPPFSQRGVAQAIEPQSRQG